jgi:hypothetical protein
VSKPNPSDEYLNMRRRRYATSSKKERGVILDEPGWRRQGTCSAHGAHVLSRFSSVSISAISGPM